MLIFFFKQKTAYEMRISDWSSDVCSSDLVAEFKPGVVTVYVKNTDYVPRKEPASGMAGGKVVNVDKVVWNVMPDALTTANALMGGEIEIGRASCRERVCPYV